MEARRQWFDIIKVLEEKPVSLKCYIQLEYLLRVKGKYSFLIKGNHENAVPADLLYKKMLEEVLQTERK